MAEEDRTREGLDEFPQDVQDDVEGLVWLGYLEDEFEIYGHSFVIRTLRGDQELYAGLLTKEFEGTLTQAKAWAWANVALCLISVDGDPDFCPPVGPDKMATARGRFSYVTTNWFWILGNYIFQRLLWLNSRALKASQAVQDLSLRSPEKSSPSPDSLTDSGTSEPTQDPEILDLVD